MTRAEAIRLEQEHGRVINIWFSYENDTWHFMYQDGFEIDDPEAANQKIKRLMMKGGDK